MTSLLLPLSQFNSLNVYGPKFWYVIHTLALGYKKRVNLLYHPYKAFIISLKELFPCDICKNHFIQNLEKYPIDNYLSNSSSIFMWSYLIHNEVNETKRKVSPSYNTCLDFTRKQLKKRDILPHIFFMLFTLAKYNNSDKSGYFVMLVSSLQYLIPIESISESYIYAIDKYKDTDSISISIIYWLYLIYREVHVYLGINYYSYELILNYFS
jgi:hypothetical protein